jgi:prephenate dehydrogenase
MAIKISIIGLGQIGASIGMALKDKKELFWRVGCDKDKGVANAAETLEVVDEIQDLDKAAQEAGIVLLSLPLGELHDILKRIGPRLRAGTVVMDTSPVKSVVLKWAQEFIPEDCFYLGLVPTLNPQSFASTESGLSAAQPDLFKQTIMVVDPPSGTPFEVEQLACDLARLLGAKPMLTDLAESDGLMASVHLLPQLVAAALLDATVDSPGWAEARKVAGRPYAGVTGGLAYYDDPASLRVAVLSNRSSVIHALDRLMDSLQSLRDDIEKGDEKSVSARLDQAFKSRENWLDVRTAAEWLKEGGDSAEMPDLGERIRQMFFGGTIADRMKRKKQLK